jgi:hypothetical protein
LTGFSLVGRYQSATAVDFTVTFAGIRMSGPPQFSVTPLAVTAVRRHAVLMAGPTGAARPELTG